MADVLGLTHLKVGQRVKIKGNPNENGDFVALEVNVKPGDESAVMEGKIQAIDPATRTIRVINRDIRLDDSVELKDMNRQPILFENLKVGDIIKLKGDYSETEGFKPYKAKLQPFKGYDIQELQGYINRIDPEGNYLDVIGFRVAVHATTEIEGY